VTWNECVDSEVSSILIAPDGSFIVYCSGNATLYRFNINADPLARRDIKNERCGQNQVDAMVVTSDGKYLIAAGGTQCVFIHSFIVSVGAGWTLFFLKQFFRLT
jgi:hypothetical protein